MAPNSACFLYVEVILKTDAQDPIHMPSHLICADGAIHAVPTGGHARVEIASRHQETPTFSVFA